MRYLTLDEAAIFHGHRGPFLVIGYKAGEVARKILSPVDEHDLYAKLFLPLRTPYSCIIDGVQCSTKCTLGKLNIEVIDNRGDLGSIVIEFRCRSSNKTLRLRVRKYIIEKLSMIRDISEGAKWVETLSAEQMFEIEIGT